MGTRASSVERIYQSRTRRRRTGFVLQAFAILAPLTFGTGVALVTTPAGHASASIDAPRVHAVTNARIVIGDGKVISKGTVVFRNGLITEVGEHVTVPADAQVLDAPG